jgi:hypothetical protein
MGPERVADGADRFMAGHPLGRRASSVLAGQLSGGGDAVDRPSSIQTSSRLAVATSRCWSQIVRFTQGRGQLLIVLAELRQHIERRDILGVVIVDALQAADLSDRTQRRAPDLAHALGDRFGGGENLVALFVQHQMVVAEIRAGTRTNGNSWS